ncbi:fatty acid amide hydrolase-like isoform X3 [Carica papaya]|uniref:fatty acid amide hydrolase-like isoform X3 n=1 Tax=Carica papaya TaxID=3649 RepID=UPI000B8CDB73|nr:fatty acid amide hydrolase-like isoform X3 [Carica papaya]
MPWGRSWMTDALITGDLGFGGSLLDLLLVWSWESRCSSCLRRIMYYHMEIFKKADVIVTPTTGMTAPIIPPSALKYGETDMRVTGYLMSFILAANLLGLPAITVPVGYDKQGLPIGLQIIGRPWGEASILRLASAVEELCAMKKQPVLFYDVLKSK